MDVGRDPVEVGRARPDEIGDVARLHFEALPDDFLPSLGLDFLERVYYPASFASPFAANLVCRVAGRPAGFVTIAHDSGRYTSDVLRRSWIGTGLHALRAAARHPRHLRLSAEVLAAALSGRSDPVPGEIVLIAVKAAYRGQGMGTQLVHASLAYLEGHAQHRCRTKTLAANHEVIAMYARLGWTIRDRFRLIGRDYVIVVSPDV